MSALLAPSSMDSVMVVSYYFEGVLARCTSSSVVCLVMVRLGVYIFKNTVLATEMVHVVVGDDGCAWVEFIEVPFSVDRAAAHFTSVCHGVLHPRIRHRLLVPLSPPPLHLIGAVSPL